MKLRQIVRIGKIVTGNLSCLMIPAFSMKEAQVGGGAEEVAHLCAATVFMILPTVALAAFARRVYQRPTKY